MPPEQDIVELELPRGAKVLTFQTKNNLPNIWCLVDPDAPKEIRRFRYAGTGHPIEDVEMEYIGTCQSVENMITLVWHLFEIKGE